MTIGELITAFIKITGVKENLESAVTATIKLAIKTIYETESPLDDKFADAILLTKSTEEVRDLVEQNPEYFIIFMSALMEFFEKSLEMINLDSNQKKELVELLKGIKIFDPVDNVG